jgi:hypothetical protein
MIQNLDIKMIITLLGLIDSLDRLIVVNIYFNIMAGPGSAVISEFIIFSNGFITLITLKG